MMSDSDWTDINAVIKILCKFTSKMGQCKSFFFRFILFLSNGERSSALSWFLARQKDEDDSDNIRVHRLLRMMRRPGSLRNSPDSHSLIGSFSFRPNLEPLISFLKRGLEVLELGYTGSEKGPGWSRPGKETDFCTYCLMVPNYFTS